MSIGSEFSGGTAANDAASAIITTRNRKRVGHACLDDIQSGAYAKKFIAEGQSNYPEMTAWRRNNAAHEIEQVGARLRAMMPWLSANALVDKSKN